MNEKDLVEIHQRCDAATEGPWEVGRWHLIDEYGYRHEFVGDLRVPYSGPNFNGPYGAGYSLDDGAKLLWSCGSDGVAPSDADAAFIAHARTDIPALLEEITRLHRHLGEIP